MLFLRWLAEQGVWAAPVAGAVLFLVTPKQHRGAGLVTALIALAALFVAALTGRVGPSRVSCDWDQGFPPTCVENAAGAAPDQAGVSVRAYRR